MDFSVESNPRIEQLNKIRQHMTRKQQEIKDAEFELELLKDRAAAELNAFVPDMLAYYLDDAAKWLHRVKDSNQDKSASAAKAAYTAVRTVLKSKVGSSITLMDITYCGLDRYAWNVHFSVKAIKGAVFSLRVPRYGHLTYDHLAELNWGKYALLRTTKKSYDGVATSWNALWYGYYLDELTAYFEPLLKEVTAQWQCV